MTSSYELVSKSVRLNPRFLSVVSRLFQSGDSAETSSDVAPVRTSRVSKSHSLALFIALFVWAHFCNRFQINISNLGPHRMPSALSHTFALSRAAVSYTLGHGAVGSEVDKQSGPCLNKCIIRRDGGTDISVWYWELTLMHVWVYPHGFYITFAC